MTYYQFVQAVESKMKEVVKDNIKVCTHTAEKNNGTIRKGITLSEKGINISPTIYLEEYYQMFQSGNSLDHITSDILRLYHEVRFQKSWNEDKISVFQGIKDKIIYRLVNRKANENMLKEVPYIPYLDLAVVFCVLLEVTKCGTATMQIRNAHLTMWDVSVKDLYEAAAENTCRFLPDDFSSMSRVIEELTGTCQEEREEYMYVLSNHIRSYGAAAILYDGRLERIGEYLKSNYYVLPSSIHEVIVVPEKSAPKKDELSLMVAEINQTQLAEEEVLSNKAYYYDREKKCLSL